MPHLKLQKGLRLQQDNIAQWDQKTNGFYEVWYLKLNLVAPQENRTQPMPALWLRFTTLSLSNGLKTNAEVWGIFFDPTQEGSPKKIAVKNTSTPSALSYRDSNTVMVQIEDCMFGPAHTSGTVVNKNNKIEWDLTFNPNAFTFFHVPKILEKLHLTKSTVCKPNVDIKFNGYFTINGTRYECKDAPGAQGHIWGKRYAHDWAWAHCNAFEGPSGKSDTVVEALSARVKAMGIMSPQMSALCIIYRGERLEWNSLMEALTMRSTYSLKQWEFEASKRTSQGTLTFKGVIDCNVRDLIGVTYEDTLGGFLYCHNSEIASMKLEVFRNGELQETLTSSRTTGFETVSREKSPYVEFLL
jgi:hypothetical protein